MTEFISSLKYINISAQKARLVADLVRGLPVDKALDVLKFSTKKVAPILLKVLNSAIANAEHNFGADIDRLFVSTIYVDEGARHRRFNPRARGRSDRIIKRTCHITVKVAEKKAKRA